MPVYQFDANRRPDEEFTPGSAAHLVVGNEGRLLDARRTPVRIAALDDRTGQFTVEILAFEDAGAQWRIDYEKAGNFQFERGSELNDDARIAEIEAIAIRFDRPLAIACHAKAAAQTASRLAAEVESAQRWLHDQSDFLAHGAMLPDPAGRLGDPRLAGDLERYMRQRAQWDIEDAFSRTFVSAPMDEMVKGHRIVIAELGLVPYEGKVARDDRLFDATWDTARRTGHIIARLAFLRALFGALNMTHVTLYRGMSTDRALEPVRNDTFVSATFCRAVAESHFDAFGPGSTGILWRRFVPVARLFMTYLETAAMNRQFREAEAVLLADSCDPAF